MSVYCIKPDTPFVTRKALKRRPPSKEYIEWVEFVDTHDFSCYEDKATGEIVFEATPKVLDENC